MSTVKVATRPKRRTVRNGKPANQLVFSAHVAGNDTVFPRILSLYVADGSTIADVTYGKGVFWCHVPEGRSQRTSKTASIAATCPTTTARLTAWCWTRPTCTSPAGAPMRSTRPSSGTTERHRHRQQDQKKYHEAVLSLYEDAGEEAHRVLRDRGVLIMKC